jgi:peptidoglycan/xylan/chitin deacetylase (PgdA/CDA1 family)
LTEPSAPGRRTFLAGAVATAAMAACSSTSSGDEGVAPSSTARDRSSTTATAAPDRAAFVAHGPRTRDEVALTFHVSGDRALAVRLLDLLKDHEVPVTAFLVGTFAEQHPDLLPRFAADGHEIANHTYRHLTFERLPAAEMQSEILRCRDALERTAGTGGTLFRISGTTNGTDAPGEAIERMAASCGYPTIVGFDVDPSDYQDPGAALVASRTIAALRPGAIVSLHFGHEGTIAALPAILGALDDRHLRPVGVSRLLRP